MPKTALSLQAQALNLNAAADYLGNGAIETPDFESEITDVVRRGTYALQRFPAVPATGHPHRYFEQTAIATALAIDPRNIAATPSSPTRVERSAFIKAIAAQTNFGLFDKEVTEQQGRFAGVMAKDINDILVSVQKKSAQMIWAGSDTSLLTPTTAEYVGALNQITSQATIGLGASIIDGIKTQVAAMISDPTYDAIPTALYMNGTLADLIDQEAKAAHMNLKEVDVVAGVKVEGISTQAGVLPIISDPYMPKDGAGAYGFAAPGAGNSNYFCVIVCESMVERPVISGADHNPNPRLFQLGLVGNLSGQFVGLKFDSVIFKGPTYAHKVVAVVRPT
jgi:hypothetical protein